MEEALGFSMMTTESPMKIPAGLANGKLEGFEKDLEVLLLQNQQQRRSRAAAAAALERERELNIFRSGSAPPTVEGARNAVGSIFGDPNFCDADLTGGFGPGGVLSEEELRSHPAYLSYYYSNENVNPRLPPPAISKEDWRVAQRFQASASAFGRIGDRRNNSGASGGVYGGSSSLYPRQHELPLRDVEEELADLRIGSLRNAPQKHSVEWGERGSDGLFGLPGIGLGARRKSFADVLQEELGGMEGQYITRNGSPTASGIQLPLNDPLFAHYPQLNDSAASLCDPSLGSHFIGSSQMDLSAYQKAYIQAMLAQHKLQNGMSFLGKSGGSAYGYRGTPGFGLGMQYGANPLSYSIISSLGSVSPPTEGDRSSQFPSMLRGSTGGSMRSWNAENSVSMEGFASSLLEEFKINKTRTFELSDIVDHVVEFSADQHGSRFIQQKLETASVEEKNKIFPEVLPHARALMTDVFGNYVIQKFFEHGTESQRKQLARQLTGHVLPLSLQMYGCRVIQKALEAVDLDQQTQMVLELDGSVMRCVRDQNGNHVIQKCIECVPQAKIQFIISAFYGQVVPLSTHPYGCRVIQRVLEHCDDAKTQSIMMDEILQAVCTLAQDQYGNYVVQHVLQHGKPQERSAIIIKLAGQIVKMSQQKFASNVIEKCLTYGTAEERQILINEMLGSTDENEPLQAMMKDQFGNYVVQKVLETCDDQNRELILSRIKTHVTSLKRYTYGKHIAARVEKVIAAGERRIGMSSHNT